MKKLSKRMNIKTFEDPGKQYCQMLHAKKRAKQRLGIDLTESLVAQIVSCIKKQKNGINFSLKWLEYQSRRLSVYEIIFENTTPVKLIYDRFRSSIVTFLFPEDYDYIYHYIDIFNNKINLKNVIGKIGKIKNDNLYLPGETVIYNEEKQSWYVSEGNLKDKTFIINECNELQEIIGD